MERQLWPRLYRLVMDAGKHHCFARKQFSDAWLALVHVWAGLHDRPTSWACDLDNWRGCDPAFMPSHLPSPSTMSRRLNGKKNTAVRQLLARAPAIGSRRS